MLEFVDLYFVQDENNFINPLLQTRSGSGSDPDPMKKLLDPTGSGSNEKITESGSGSSSLLFSINFLPVQCPLSVKYLLIAHMNLVICYIDERKWHILSKKQ